MFTAWANIYSMGGGPTSSRRLITSVLFVLLLFLRLARLKAAIGISYLSRFHLAVKWGKCLYSLIQFYWHADPFIIHRCCSVCCIYICVCVCVLPGSRSMLLFLENPLDGEVCCLQWRTGIIKVKWRVLLQNTLGENLFRTFRNVLTLSMERNKCDSNRHLMFDWLWAFTTQLYEATLWMFMFKYAAASVVYWEGIFLKWLSTWVTSVWVKGTERKRERER